MKKVFAVALLAALCCVPAARAQSSGDAYDDVGGADSGPVKGSRQIEAWFAGGPGFDLNHSVYPVSEIDMGARLGWVLTGPHGPGITRGRFSYAFDIMPALLVMQPGRVVYGGGFDPFAVQWIFATHHRYAPFIELSGGGLFTVKPVPIRSTSFNFVPTAGVGVYTSSGKYAWSVDVRWFHISNAEVISYDPGINTLQIRVAFGLFRRPK